ncbi:hypothetical protein [Oceanobacillus bengalensis]|uniref:Uncharacterized protein n=1 Tax=Oceanobacillus bengalensis TaxID=1435466 RepID=A0A494YSL4_9BACI|nr:hypothetical protein [Oceanobacillus bengalensis]RKQ12978.1 hypothetical protein D8M05_17445 [Oceanobacillus bengalensis]
MKGFIIFLVILAMISIITICFLLLFKRIFVKKLDKHGFFYNKKKMFYFVGGIIIVLSLLLFLDIFFQGLVYQRLPDGIQAYLSTISESPTTTE